MRIVVTNCNTTPEMTEEIVRGARSAAGPGTTVAGLTPPGAPESAEGWLDSHLSAAAVLDALRTYGGPAYDAVVLAGFGEHGREGVRELVDVPVVDITEAAAHLACLLRASLRRHHHPRPVPRPDRGQPETAGVAPQLRRRRRHRPRRSRPRRGPGPDRSPRSWPPPNAPRDAGAEVLVLGCAGMTGLERTVGEKLGLPVVDGVGAAVKLAESLVVLGLTTSRAGGYAKPLPKARGVGTAARISRRRRGRRRLGAGRP